MTNQRPAAHRKIGLSAMRTLPLGILLAGLWVYFLSIDTLIEFMAQPDKEPRAILILASAACFTVWLLFGTRFSPFTLPEKLQRIATSSLHVFALLLGLANTVFALPSIPAVQSFATAILEGGGDNALVVLLGLMIVGGSWWLIDKFVPPKYARRIEWTAGILAVVIGLFYSPWQVVNFAIIGITIPCNLLLARYWWLTFKEWGKEHQEYKNLFVFGKGGSARFGGIYSFAKYDFSRFMRGDQHMHAPIYMGKTAYYDDPKIGGRSIGLNSQSMMMTIAKPGGGKSLYTAWTELLTWPNGCAVLDPKGEHYMMTGQARARNPALGQSYAVDPWRVISRTIAKEKIGVTTGAEGMRGYINPLDAIDIKAVSARDDLMLIVSASIFKQGAESENARFFRESCMKIVLGIIVHVLTRMERKYHNLPAIFDMFLMGHPDNEQIDHDDFLKLIHEMSGNEALGKAPMEAAKLYTDASPNTRGGFITTITTEFGWVNNTAIRPVISKSNFAFSDIKQKKASMYLVIPFEYLHEHRRFSQTVLSMALLSCREEAPDDRWTLFLLDEFAQLGTFKPVSDGLVTLRGRKVKLHLFLQNIGLLKDNYDNVDRFMAACDKQYFAVSDTKTAQALHEELGEYLERWQEGVEGETRSIDRERPLLSVAEILAFLKEGSGNQIVIPTGGNPMRLKLVPFTKHFSPREYGRVFENDDDPNAPEPRASWEPDPAEDSPSADPQPDSSIDPEAEREKERQWERSMNENRSDQAKADAEAAVDGMFSDLQRKAREMGEDTSWFKPDAAAEAQKQADTDELVRFMFSDMAYDPEKDWAQFYAKFETDLDDEAKQQVLWHIERQKRGERTSKP